jgi:hypothetical protein
LTDDEAEKPLQTLTVRTTIHITTFIYPKRDALCPVSPWFGTDGARACARWVESRGPIRVRLPPGQRPAEPARGGWHSSRVQRCPGPVRSDVRGSSFFFVWAPCSPASGVAKDGRP